MAIKLERSTIPTQYSVSTLRNPSFWLVVAMLAVCALLHYSPHVAFLRVISPEAAFGLTRHVMDRILFILPVTYAAFIFGVKGYTNYRDLYDYFESGYGFSVRYNIKPRIHIKYQPNVDDIGSADSARINMNYYEVKTPVFAVQGDNIFDINVKDIMQFHRDKGALMTIVLREVDNVEGLGIADIDKNCRIRR